MEHGPFPKLSATATRRGSIESWLEFHGDTPVRYISGPTGSGKTTAVCLYARHAGHAVSFVRIPDSGTPAALLAEINRVLDCDLSELEDIASAAPDTSRFELIVAGIDQADVQLRALLEELPARVPAHVTFTYLARAGAVIDMVSLTTKGIGVSMERARLAFTQAETAELCESLGVTYAPADVNQLVYASEGWAFAVTGAVRGAAADRLDLRGALARWQERHRRLVDELLARSLNGLSPEHAAAAQRIYAGAPATDDPVFDDLHDLGLLFSFSDRELRPLRALTSATIKRTPRVESVPVADVPIGAIEMFGAFEMTIDDRKVEWFRRRDRQLIEYLALQVDASATRRDLIAKFWPNTDEQLANQSLRTACSTIRRAIAQCAGYDRVHFYFSAGRTVRLQLDYLTITSQRLRVHMRDAEEALANEEEAAAHAHYLAASRLYRGRLLDSEGHEPWFAAEREMFAEMAAIAAERALEMRSRKKVESPFESIAAQLKMAPHWTTT